MKKISIILTATLTTIAAIAAFTATASAEGTSKYATSIKSANRIVDEWMDDAIESVREGDKREFAKLFDNSITSENVDLAWEGYNNYLFGDKIYEADTSALAFSKDEIVFEIFWYSNKIDSKKPMNYSFSSNNAGMSKLKLEDGKWVASVEEFSDNVAKKINKREKDIYGENAYKNGFCSIDYQQKYGKALTAGLSVGVKTAVVNKDGSMTIKIGFINGLNKNITVKTVKGDISFGKNRQNVKKAIDLSRIGLANISIPAKTVKYVTVNISASQLVNEINNGSEMAYCSTDISASFRS